MKEVVEELRRSNTLSDVRGSHIHLAKRLLYLVLVCRSQLMVRAALCFGREMLRRLS